jgi:hypothetical protein
MAICAQCKQPVIKTLWVGEEILLAPGPRVFATLEPFGEDPADGTKVFCCTNSYVEHSAVCSAARRAPKKQSPGSSPLDALATKE